MGWSDGDNLGDSSRLSRRECVAFGFGFALVGCGLLLPGDVEAGEEMCAGDPQITVGSTVVRETINIIARVPKQHVAPWGNVITAATPIQVQISLPTYLTGQLVALDPVLPESVSFLYDSGLNLSDGISVKLGFSIKAPSPGGLRYVVEWTGITRLETKIGKGTSTAWTGTTMKFPKIA